MLYLKFDEQILNREIFKLVKLLTACKECREMFEMQGTGEILLQNIGRCGQLFFIIVKFFIYWENIIIDKSAYN